MEDNPNVDRAIKERAVRAISSVLRLTPEEEANLRLETGYKTLKKWTSARHAEIVVAIEDEFQIEIDEISIPKLNNVVKFVAYIQSKTGV
ncbi:MAG: acyl carrier protein [Rhodomicrobium sp.]